MHPSCGGAFFTLCKVARRSRVILVVMRRQCSEEDVLGPPPKKIRINHDDYYASLVGRTRDGRQFFITQPFIPYLQDFVARYLFDQAGTCIDVKVHDLGVRATGEPPGNALLNNDKAEQIQRTFLLELGETELCDIEVIPFSHIEYGTTFGLIIDPPVEPDGKWSVVAEPGNYMAFYPPWDGDYYT